MVKIITPVETEPVSLAEVRQHLRLPEEQTEDDLLLGLIRTARAYCENFTRCALAEQTLEMYLDRFPVNSSIMLPYPPLRSVMEIGCKDSAGIEMILPTSDYIVDTDREPGRVMPGFGVSWPVFTPFPAAPIRIRFVAGYAVLPEPIRQAMLLLVGHWYENREATGTAKDQTAFSVHALLSPYRVEEF
ncbi:MAG: head-tail connector protein [Bacillota bacterium]|nr:head-tail connector protein [Bacillota bacterium]